MSSARTAVLEKYPLLFPYDPSDEKNLFYVRTMDGWMILLQTLYARRVCDGNGADIRYPMPVCKFPPVSRCPRWFGKSQSWRRPQDGVVEMRFSNFDGMDRICTLLEQAGRSIAVTPHKRPGEWIVEVFPSVQPLQKKESSP